MRLVALLFAIICAVSATAQTLTVTSPLDNDYLGKNNSVSFNITGAVLQVTVKVVATLDSNPATKIEVQDDFTPDDEGKINSSLALNFGDGTPEGAWTLTVSATEPGNSYTNVVIPVTVDVNSPKFLDSSPLNNSYVKGVVEINVELEEPNVEEWRVKLNGSDIPNNTGSTNLVSVLWDTAGITDDGDQTILITVKDLAGNTSSKSLKVTVDRIKPSITILAPTETTTIRPAQLIAFVVEVEDQFPDSVHDTGIDVVLKRLDDSFLARVPRQSITRFGNTMQFTGRLRHSITWP